MKNVVLAYTPGPFPYYMWNSRAFPPNQWVPAEFEPLISYQSPNQSSTVDELFDSVWFVGTTAPSGKTVLVPPRDPWMNNSLSANETDWREFLGAQLAAVRALENASVAVSVALGRKVSPTIMLTLPYPDTRQTEFGMADTDRVLNFSRTRDRVAGASWYASYASQRFRTTQVDEGWSHVRFVGFYWVFESICGCVNHAQTGCTMCDTEADPQFQGFHIDDAAILPSIATHVHSLPGQLMLNWIPYYDRYNLLDDDRYVLHGNVIYAANYLTPKPYTKGALTNISYPGAKLRCSELVERKDFPACPGGAADAQVTFDKHFLRALAAPFSAFTRKRNAPLWVDQWGIHAAVGGGNTSVAAYLADAIEIFAVK